MSAKMDVKIPDIGGASGVDVIEILVKKGDSIEIDTPLITLESDKASMEIPSPAAGVVDSIKLNIGDKVSEGSVILILKVDALNEKQEEKSSPVVVEVEAEPVRAPETASAPIIPLATQTSPSIVSAEVGASTVTAFAGPAVRRLAHELGLNLTDVQGSGRKSRITKEDVQLYVKTRLSQAGSTFSPGVTPQIDFSQYGEIEIKPLNKIKRLTGANLHRSWITVPHVTQFDEADITALEEFRKKELEQVSASGVKLTVLAFVCKVVSKALGVFPAFNASLDSDGTHLIYKQFVNIGIAVETPNGLVVPVIKGVDRLSIVDIAKEMARLSAKARDKTLMPVDMTGGCFTISSLGGIGGTAFTPIVNYPEVAILGLSRAAVKPIFCKSSGEFKPRLMLPLSLSYDHRVIDGAEGARFTQYLVQQLSDIRRVLL